MTKGFILIVSGLSGSGKSTVSKLVVDELHKRSIPIFHMESDWVKSFFGDTDYRPEARLEGGRRMCFGAHLLSEFGINIIINCVMGTTETRKLMRSMIDFREIYMNADIKKCIQNDPRGIYEKNLGKNNPMLRGVDLPFEPPDEPVLVLHPYIETPQESSRKIINYLEKVELIDVK